ncbi:Peptidyl-prolyl cis-trans isomerase FKBP20-2, chloroplastic, partial [Dichanthelium oligosanthes]
LEKVLERVWSGGGGGSSEGAFAQALERTRDSAAELRDAAAAAAEMRQAAARHRDMASLPLAIRKPLPPPLSLRFGGWLRGRSRRGDGYGSPPREAWSSAAGSTGRCDTALLAHWHVGPPGVSSAASACGWARSTSARAPSAPQSRNGTDSLDAIQFRSSHQNPSPNPKPKPEPADRLIPFLRTRRTARAGREKTEEKRAIWGGDGADAHLPLRALLLQSDSCCAKTLSILGDEKKDLAEGRIPRREAFSLLLASPVLSVAFSAYGKSKNMNPYDERRLLQQNKKIQEANRAPEDFPNFIREEQMGAFLSTFKMSRTVKINHRAMQCISGFQVKVVTSDNYITRDSGLMYEDFKVGTGNSPKDGQQIIFHYVGYNEAGRRIDSTYIQGSPAKIRLGNGTLVPGKSQLILDIDNSGFEEGIRDMKPGGRRRIIIPPELGPPVGPSTFFSAKQFEVFDVELLAVQDCQRRTIAFYSDVVCS